MKNIHVLPTEKFSNLILQTNGELRLSELELRGQVGNGFTQNIYITSDEEIKDGDWVLDKFNQRWKLEDKKLIGFDSQGIKIFSTDNVLGHECKKIILTTNQDLIKDGVQAINDEFLEWFVKNPSCEFVEVTEYLDSGFSYGYKIIIPKEEPKQDLPIVNGSYGCTIQTKKQEPKQGLPIINGSYGCTIQTKKQEPKQETLEELKKWREEVLIAHEINQKVIKKLMDEKSEQIDSEKKIDKILQKLEEIKIMINLR